MTRTMQAAARTMLALALLLPGVARADNCTTQSQMSPADRTALAQAGTALAAHVQSDDAAGLGTLSTSDVARNTAALSEIVGSTSPHLKGATLVTDQLYLLDGSSFKPNADGSFNDASFFCTLNKSQNEADFLIPSLPPGKYAFVMVESRGVPAPWRLSFLLRQDSGRWLMAGIYPKPMTAAGHDGLWYWTQARQMVARKQPWSAWLYYQQAIALLQPAGFVQSTHLEKLNNEATAARPPAISEGVTAEKPLVVKAKDGTEYSFTSLGVDDSLGASSIDIAVHLKADSVSDQAAARKRNIAAMSALLAAYPELRTPFHGIWVFADAPGQQTYATEQTMSAIP